MPDFPQCDPTLPRSSLKIICRFAGQISPCLWVDKFAHPLERTVNAKKGKIMNAKNNKLVSEGTGALGNSIGPARKLIQAAIEPGWRIMPLAILDLGLIT